MLVEDVGQGAGRHENPGSVPECAAFFWCLEDLPGGGGRGAESGGSWGSTAGGWVGGGTIQQCTNLFLAVVLRKSDKPM